MLFLDLETYNTQPIENGTYKYAETAEVLLFAWAEDDGPVDVWDVTTGAPMPWELRALLDDDTVRICAHNAQFDRAVLEQWLDKPIRRSRWVCSMVKAYSHGFPGSLDVIGGILGLSDDRAKLASGKKLINRFCKPAPANHRATRYDKSSHPEEWALFVEYAARDIEAMRTIYKQLPPWNWQTQDIKLYHHDQEINSRGFCVDTSLVAGGVEASEEDKAAAAKEFRQLTGGMVNAPTQREKFRLFLNDRFNQNLDNTRAETFRVLLKRDDLNPTFRRLMELSINANKTSTAKYAKLAPAVSPDGRFRGGLQFRGASRTRRWAGRTFQPQNLPSRGLPKQHSIDLYARALKAGCASYVFGGDSLAHASGALRSVLIAPEGKKLAIADLSNIEGRILAYLATESWKLEAFEAYDRGEGPDLYNITATSILGGDPYEVEKHIRNAFGKVPDLAFGYEGGFGACQTFANAYGVRFKDNMHTIAGNVSYGLIEKARQNWTFWGKDKNPEADADEWEASEIVKLAWRERHPRTVTLWSACKEAAVLSIENPGNVYKVGRFLKFGVQTFGGHAYLTIRLPSGAYLCYFQPKYNPDTRSITYMGIDSTATGGAFGKWQRLYTYGGKMVENACQSLAYDIMSANMQRIEQAGYKIVLTVHDEIIAETEDGTGEELAKLMARPIKWAPGFPLAADGFTTTRYKKG